jgi:hypothetical protein
VTRTHTITFKDGTIITFRDVIVLTESQKKQILNIASNYTRNELLYDTKGFDLEDFTLEQQQSIILTKNEMVFNKTPKQLLERNVIAFSKHALERLLEREGSNSLKKQFKIIYKIIESDSVLKAQYKGNSSLTYTLAKNKDKEGYKIPINFKWMNGERQILTVTITRKDAPTSQMSTKVGADQEILNRMEEFKKKLKERKRKSR